MSTEEKAFQSSLLRLVILCSTGLASLVPTTSSPSQLHLTFTSSSQSIPSRKHFASLRKQIRQDALQLFTESGKRATSLGIALKPSSSQAKIQSATVVSSSTEILDNASILAAQRQIDDWNNDLVPKIIFLANKCWKEAQVYVKEEEADAEDRVAELSGEHREERSRMEELAKQMGGVVMTGAELRGEDSANAYKKPANLGLGLAWAKIFRSQVGQILQAIASLAEACMDQRTRAAVQLAGEARDRREGHPVRRPLPSLADSGASRTLESVRRDCLEKTAGVLEACENAVKLLPQTNLAAVKAKWADRGELLEDGLEELTSAVSASESQEHKDEDDLDSDFSTGKRALVRRLGPLLRIGRLAHDRIMQTCLTTAKADGDATDLDSLDELSELLTTLQDDLIAAVTWGDFDEMEVEEDVTNFQEAGADATLVNGGTEKPPAMKAKKMCSDYCEVIHSFSSYVPGDEKIQAMAEEMRKFVEGITDAEWEAAIDNEEA